MKQKRLLAHISVALLFPLAAFAEPTSDMTTVYSIRPYIQTNTVFVQVSADVICQTSTFKIDLAKLNGKAAYAAALVAMVGNKNVRLEVANATGCTGWGTELQSITVFAQ